MKHVRTLKRSALALAIAMAASAPLHAQSNSQGYIFGQVSGGDPDLVVDRGAVDGGGRVGDRRLVRGGRGGERRQHRQRDQRRLHAPTA